MKPIHVVKAIAAKTQSELDAILPELKAAIRDHIRYLRAIGMETIPDPFGTQFEDAAKIRGGQARKELEE
jgi:hypothetical protein